MDNREAAEIGKPSGWGLAALGSAVMGAPDRLTLRDMAAAHVPHASRHDIKTRQAGRIRLAYLGLRAVFDVIFRAAGVVLILTASLMWFWPGSAADVPAAMMKLGLSVFVLFCGLALFMRHHEDAMPEVEFDSQQREMRVCQRDTRGRWEVNSTYPFDRLAAIRLMGRVIRVEAENGDIVLQMRLRDQASRDVMRSILSEEFPQLA